MPVDVDALAHRRVFVLRLAAKPEADGMHKLRVLLKQLLRRHGFRALDVREEEHAPALDAWHERDHVTARGGTAQTEGKENRK